MSGVGVSNDKSSPLWRFEIDKNVLFGHFWRNYMHQQPPRRDFISSRCAAEMDFRRQKLPRCSIFLAPNVWKRNVSRKNLFFRIDCNARHKSFPNASIKVIIFTIEVDSSVGKALAHPPLIFYLLIPQFHIGVGKQAEGTPLQPPILFKLPTEAQKRS